MQDAISDQRLHKLLLTRGLDQASITALWLNAAVYQSGLPGITSCVVTDVGFVHMVQYPVATKQKSLWWTKNMDVVVTKR